LGRLATSVEHAIERLFGRLASTESLLDVGHDGVVVGELPRLQFRVDELSIDTDLESAPVGGDQAQLSDAPFDRSQDLVRQTDGLRLVVSNRAINEFQLHLDCPQIAENRRHGSKPAFGASGYGSGARARTQLPEASVCGKILWRS
jgi:hypothetical protein